VCDGRWVGQHQPTAHGIVKGSSQHGVDLQNTLVVEAARSVGAAVFAKLSVEALEVIDAQMPQRHPPMVGTTCSSMLRR
jgi:hypothetical protein